MSKLPNLLENNRSWAASTEAEHPGIFDRLAGGQSPEYLWIGCSDSRVPANDVIGLLPGELFVHRNIANQIIHSDTSALSVLQYSIDVLKVKHVIVCGHYLCGGVMAGMGTPPEGPIDGWLDQVKAIYQKNKDALSSLSEEQQVARMCELNVKHQVLNVATNSIVKEAWARGQELSIHGFIYDLKDGQITDLEVSTSDTEAADQLESTLEI